MNTIAEESIDSIEKDVSSEASSTDACNDVQINYEIPNLTSEFQITPVDIQITSSEQSNEFKNPNEFLKLEPSETGPVTSNTKCNSNNSTGTNNSNNSSTVNGKFPFRPLCGIPVNHFFPV